MFCNTIVLFPTSSFTNGDNIRIFAEDSSNTKVRLAGIVISILGTFVKSIVGAIEFVGKYVGWLVEGVVEGDIDGEKDGALIRPAEGLKDGIVVGNLDKDGSLDAS